MFILSKFGRVVYANIPGMDLMNYFNLNIGDRVLRNHWNKATGSNSNGIFMLDLQDQNYQWFAKKLHNGFSYLVANKVIESNLLFTRA